MDDQGKNYIKILEGIATAMVNAEKKAIDLGEHEHFLREVPRALRKIAKLIEKRKIKP